MAISRAQILKELEPGLNAIFGTEYNRYENEHAVLFDEETSNRALKKKYSSQALVMRMKNSKAQQLNTLSQAKVMYQDIHITQLH